MTKPKTGSRKKTQVKTKSGTFSTKLTRKQKAFADEIINSPKQPNSDAIKKTYNVTDTNTASQMALENLRKPEILAYMNTYKDKAQEVIVDLLDDNNSRIQLDSAKDILDRTAGKAIQRTEVQSTGVTIHLDLSS